MSSSKPRPRRYHTYPDEKLQEIWDKEGNEEALGALEDRKIVRDMCCNPNTQFRPHQVPLGPRFWVLFRKQDSLVGKRVEMWLNLEENTTQEKVERYWPEIRQWQVFLREWQGPEDGGRDRFINDLHTKHSKGYSYAELANYIVDTALHKLEWYRTIRRESWKCQKFEKAIKEIDSWTDDEMHHWVSECTAALQLFMFVDGYDETKVYAWFKAALIYLHSDGKQAIPSEHCMPVDGPNIRETIRRFRGRYKLRGGVGEIR